MAVSPMSIKVEGVKEAQAYLNKEVGSIKRGVTQGVKNATLFMTGEVKQSIAGYRTELRSVDSGRFLSSVDYRFGPDYGEVFTNVPYAVHLEYGTSRIKPRPHFRNSLNRNRNKINGMMAQDVKKSV